LTDSDSDYQYQYDRKVVLFNEAICSFTNEIDYFPSKNLEFRTRIEFGINKFNEKLNFSMTKNSDRVEIQEMAICDEKIRELMPRLIDYLNKNREFSKKLFQVEFQVSRSGDAMISLIYHKKLDEDWKQDSILLSKLLDCSIIGRSRKQSVVNGENFVTETYKSLSHEYSLKLFEQCFSQTNPGICDDMLCWVEGNSQAKDDIVELHCGQGTFTILFSKMFQKVLATENSRSSVRALKENLSINKATNVYSARMSGHETLDALQKTRPYRRMEAIDLSEFKFSSIFLDPPRSGLDKDTLAAVSSFNQIIYISCGFDSLIRDLNYLNKTHFVKKAAMFDQFPYTDHLESGLILEKK
jgi:tRNA (uracil-5-)-methyltransferase